MSDGATVPVDEVVRDAHDLDVFAFQLLGGAITEVAGSPDDVGRLPEGVRVTGELHIERCGGVEGSE